MLSVCHHQLVRRQSSQFLFQAFFPSSSTFPSGTRRRASYKLCVSSRWDISKATVLSFHALPSAKARYKQEKTLEEKMVCKKLTIFEEIIGNGIF
jgi:hypothetical protein